MIGVAIVTPFGIEERFIDENGGSDEICVVKRNGMVSTDGLTVLLIFTSSPTGEPIAGNGNIYTLSPIKILTNLTVRFHSCQASHIWRNCPANCEEALLSHNLYTRCACVAP